MSDLHAAPLAYVERGWHVFPLHGIVNGRCTCGRRDCSSPGKHPITRHGLKDATTDIEQVGTWWRRWRYSNIGVATGAPSGIAVIDIDLGHRANTAFDSPGEEKTQEGSREPNNVWDSLGRVIHKLPRTLIGLTGGGGVHLIYRRVSELRCTCSRLPGLDSDLPGIDLRGDGGYIVAPPSVHRSGRSYEWLDANRPVAAAPVWLKQPERTYVALEDVAATEFDGHGTPYGLAVLRDELDRLRAAHVGTRNHTLNRCGFVLAQLAAGGELLESAARSCLLAASLSIGLDEAESRQTIESAFDAGSRSPRCAPHRLRST